MQTRVLLDDGSGGRASQRLVSNLFLKYFGNPTLNALNDAARLALGGEWAMSTDSYTVDPIFFPGGDIGRLAVHGTVNDVSMLGAVPRYLSCGFILEEGLPLDDLERIVSSMALACKESGVIVVTGDTKVVPKGTADKIFINTAGLGEIVVTPPPSGDRAAPGDAILVSGTLGDHGLTILSQRQGLSFDAPVKSDSAPLNRMAERLVRELPEVHVLRDPTRGGAATTLNEIAESSKVCCVLDEQSLPIRPEVAGGCSFLGLDPLYLANEGKMFCILPEADAEAALAILREDRYGAEACRIGTVTDEHQGRVVLQTPLGGKRLLGMLEGEQLPRIC
ncbi:MAG: hydrogenase expression/formation protein HypE [Desulfovibrionales bacterium]|jgi:hydrogenase expression/formation protein HypE|nr:hydrogenase expression/formation protein HypE [Desulfovibrionales bacterium]